jgi:uncharacterized membrane protein
MTDVISLLVAFAGYSIHSIAQAGQKIGFAITDRHRTKGVIVWILSTLSMPISAFLILYAVSIGDASLVGAMSGSGLASLAIFSHLYMREGISKQELIGVFTVIVAAILIGSFKLGTIAKEPSLSALYIYLPAVCGTYLLLWLLFRRRTKIVGIVIAGFAGAMGGFVPLFQKISTSPRALSQPLLRFHFRIETPITMLLKKVADLLSNPWALAWIVISLLSMVVMQFAYRRGKAIQLIPAFAANTIAIPVIGGVVAFEERLHPIQWIGVALIIAGVFLITLKTSYNIHPPKRTQ